MADVNVLNSSKNEFFIGTQNDVVSSPQHIMVTDEPSDGNNSTINNNVLVEQMDNCGAVGVSALSLNENEKISIVLPAATTTTTITTVDNNNAINSTCMAAGKLRGKRRRRKTKSKCNGGGGGGQTGGNSSIGSNGKPYRKSNWKFQMPRSSRRQGDEVILSTLVPYNTNKFLMEEHMPEYSIMGKYSPSSAAAAAAAAHLCRNRDSSFSYDSADENNYFPEDEEEFLTKEFKSVYEDARTERLDGMSKTQLIHEYLQLEANYDKLSNNLDRRKCEDEREVELANNESRSVIMKQDERIKELLAENLGKFFFLIFFFFFGFKGIYIF